MVICALCYSTIWRLRQTSCCEQHPCKRTWVINLDSKTENRNNNECRHRRSGQELADGPELAKSVQAHVRRDGRLRQLRAGKINNVCSVNVWQSATKKSCAKQFLLSAAVLGRRDHWSGKTMVFKYFKYLLVIIHIRKPLLHVNFFSNFLHRRWR